MPRGRVLHIADSPYMGGITSHIVSVAEAFKDDPDWDIALATLPGKHRDETLYKRAAAAGFEVTTIAMDSTFDMNVRTRLREFVVSSEITIVHTHGYRANVIASMSRLHVPVITTSHGLAVQPTMRSRLWQAMHLRFMRRQAAVVACSEHVAQQLRGKGMPPDHITVVRNAAPPPNGTLAPRRRVEFGIAEDAIIALYVGRLDAGKRLNQVIGAVESLPQWHLLVVGDGPERASLERAAKERVTFCGAIADPNPFYALTDVVVLPTVMEALPMTLIEAAAHGKPAVASNVGGVPEVVLDGITGILVDYADGWVDALQRLSDAETRLRMGAAACARHNEHFSLDALRQSLAMVYTRLAS